MSDARHLGRPPLPPGEGWGEGRLLTHPFNNPKNHSLKDTHRNFLKATQPCVITYDYARIRRLVRLVRGSYRFRVTEKQ